MLTTADKIRAYRLKAGITRKMLGEALKLRETTIAKKEMGKSEYKINEIRAAAEYLGIDVHELI